MTNILSQRWLLNRRHFLRGIGATVALPLLNAMIPASARAAAALDKPRRSVFVYIPNGVNGMTWQVTKSGRDFELSSSLQPLAQHRDDFILRQDGVQFFDTGRFPASWSRSRAGRACAGRARLGRARGAGHQGRGNPAGGT